MVSIKFEERLLSVPLSDQIPATRDGKLVIIHGNAGLSTQDIIEEYRLSFIQPVVALVNEKTTDLTETLGEDDQVRLLPQIAGGQD